MEDDHKSAKYFFIRISFQSTSPVWRTTAKLIEAKAITLISIHVPVWRTTSYCRAGSRREPISIHVPRVEDDWVYNIDVPRRYNFNPRPPCGGRRMITAHSPSLPKFQSTSPVWRTTFLIRSTVKPKRISIHVPRVEDDFFNQVDCQTEKDFNPRPPCGGRLF